MARSEPPTPPEGPPPRQLVDGLDRVLAGLGAPTGQVLRTVVECWPELVGPEVAAVTEPVSIEHGRLLLGITEPAWASQVRWMEADVVRRAAELLGPGVITSLETTVRRSRR